MVTANSIKTRLRINHSALDDQFEADIEAAKAELLRVGVLQDAVEDEDNPLIDMAIMSYCMWLESETEKVAAGYEAQWNQWKDELRKSPNYGYEVD